MLIRLLISGFICVFCLPVFGQITTGKIEYHMTTHSLKLDKDLKQKLEGVTDSTQIAEMIAAKEKVDAFMNKHDTHTYKGKPFIFNQNICRDFNTSKYTQQAYKIYNFGKKTVTHHRIKNEEILVDNVLWGNGKNPFYVKEYTIEKNQKIRKNILGYDCYQVIIHESKSYKDTKPLTITHELFVTDEILFPPDYILELYETLIQGCALEIKTIKSHDTKHYTINRAVSFTANIDKKLLKKPKIYKKHDRLQQKKK